MEWHPAPLGPKTNIDWTQFGLKRPVDPYLIWLDMVGLDAIGTANFKTLYSGKLPVLLELAAAYSGQEGLPAEVPPVYRDPIGTGAAARFVSARVTPSNLHALLKNERVLRVQLELSKIPDAAAGDWAKPGSSPEQAPSASTWLGVIDVGCAFAHAKYCSTPVPAAAPASRVKHVWDQSAARKPERAAAKQPRWAAADKLGYGAELDEAALQAALGAWPDEPQCYSAVGMAPLQERRVLHGLGVLDLMAGRPSPLLAGPPPPKNPPDSAAALPIAFVQLESLESRDTTLSSLGVHVLDGMRWMLDRVENQAGKRDPYRKLVVNLSYGGLAGPHDGSSVLECALDELIEKRGNLAVVMSAGNSYDPERATHAKIDVSSDNPGSIHWRAQPDDPTDNFLEIWFPGTDVADVQLRVTAPGGVRSGPLLADSTWLLREAGASGPVLAGAMFRSHAANGEKRAMFLLALQPSEPRGGGPARAPAGTWKVEIENSRAASQEVHAWIERDDYVSGNLKRRQQSSLIDPGDGSVTTDHGMSSIAHGRHTVVVGGYCLADRKAADETASGPGLGAGARQGPDISAPSDEARSTPGLLVSGATTGAAIRMSGTSAAAPSVARWVANWFASQQGSLSIGDLRAAMAAVAHRTGDQRLGPILLDPALRPTLGKGWAPATGVNQTTASALPAADAPLPANRQAA